MSIDGRITIDALFHDRSGDDRLKVLSLASSNGYTTGKVVAVTGTAAGNVGIAWGSYRDASGSLVTLNNPEAIAFSWSGANYRTLSDTVNANCLLKSKSGQVAFSLIDPGLEPSLEIQSEDTATTGTYTIIMWGAD